MTQFVSDTHAVHWHLTDDPNLSPIARAVFEEADRGLHQVFVPGIVLIEMVYLVERGRLAPEPVERMLALVGASDGSFALAGLDQGTARALHQVPRSAVPEMPDRIILATALQLGLPLISRDEAIRRAAVVPVIW
ncbi:MAG: type II toxin-antitoxin system VapC family toxin [Chloroflexota bacterium]|nr:type II toxin-antitoxin system VapC family toxin [Chloroflexota bacterium]